MGDVGWNGDGGFDSLTDDSTRRGHTTPEQDLALAIIEELVDNLDSADMAIRNWAINDMRLCMNPRYEGGLLVWVDVIRVDWGALVSWLYRRYPWLEAEVQKAPPGRTRPGICQLPHCQRQIRPSRTKQGHYCDPHRKRIEAEKHNRYCNQWKKRKREARHRSALGKVITVPPVT